MGNTAFGLVIFGSYFLFLAVIVIAVAIFAPGATFWALFTVGIIVLFARPSFKTGATDRQLTDAEVKLQIVCELREHLESEEHSDGYCGDDCPVPDILKKITQ